LSGYKGKTVRTLRNQGSFKNEIYQSVATGRVIGGNLTDDFP